MLEAGTDITVFENIVGSGPFMGLEFTQSVGYEFEKNSTYFKEGRPFLNGIEGFIITDKGREIAAFRTEQVLMNLSGANNLAVEDFEILRADQHFSSSFDIWPLDGVGGHHLLLNTTKAPFDDERVRRAIFLALDRQAMVEGFGDETWKVGSPMSPTSPFALPREELLNLPGYRQLNGQKHPDDLAEARQLMADAGLAGGFQGTIHGLAVEYLGDAAVVVAEQLRDTLNIDLEVIVGDIGATIGLFIGANFDIGVSGHGPTIADPDDRFQDIYLESGRNWSFWSDPAVDALFEQVQRESDFERRQELSFEMQRLVLNGSPGTIEFIWKPFGQIVSKRINTEAGHFVASPSLQVSLKHEHEWLELE